MCVMYYLASDLPLPTVAVPGFAVTAVGGDVEERIQLVLTSPFIYFLSSWQGCSCGFCCEEGSEVQRQLAEIPDEQVRDACLEAWQGGRNSVQALARYLAEQTGPGSLTLYVAHAGREGAPIRHRGTIAPGYFAGAAVASLPEDSLLAIAAVPR